LQNKANELLASSDLFDNCYDNINDCIVLIDNQTCGVNVLACNNTLNIKETKRQIGSTIKPILVYMPAMEENIITATTLINDEKTNFGGYSPSNFDDVYYGDVTVRHAIKKSLNIPAVKTLNYLGMDSFFEYADKLDINLNNNDRNLSSALGGLTNGIDLISLTSSYTSLANYGMYSPSKFIKKIEDDKGNILYENVTNFTPVFSKENSFIMTDILMDSVADGTAHKMDVLPFDIASKTGTVGYEYGNSDAYNISYTTLHTIGVWAGSKKGVFSNYISGGNTCSFIARDLFDALYKDHIPPDFQVPPTVHLLNIDMENLNVNHEITLASDATPDKFIQKEYFSQNNLPVKVSKYFDDLKVVNADVDIIQKYPNVKFTALPYIIYEVYQLDGDTATLIKTIEDKSGEMQVIDSLAADGKTYRYSVIPYIYVKGGKRKLEQGIFTSRKVIMPLKFSPKNPDAGDIYDIENWWDIAI
ncbi:MAG: penicillin-binding transpeptidase domain-containing protein, partial [Firmicutes bacterium]|nr:penicillin-binding transpeptidase domain-containing protein [Bacillota bacterium]